MDVNDLLLIEQIRNGKESAFRYLYDNHYVVLCRLANAWVNDPYVAETIVGDTIVHIYEIRETLNITTSLRSYLIKAVRNRCLNYIKQETHLSEVSIEEADVFEYANKYSLAETPLTSLLERELEEKIEEAIRKLPKETRAVFTKSRFEHKKNEEIAEELGISVNTVKYHMKRALSILHNDLGKYFVFLFLFD